MEKIKWLRKIVEQNPEDAEAHYWLGMELSQKGEYLEAVQTLSMAIAKCENESLKMDIIQELSKVSLLLNRSETQGIKEEQKESTPKHSEEKVIQNVRKIKDETLGSSPKNPNVTQLQKQASQKFKVIDGGEKTPEVQEERKTITFDDVAGLEDLKKTIHLRIISPFFNQGLFAKFRKKAGGGVLLYGPPGCGKTYIARATAGECHAHFYPIHIADILDPYIGVSEQKLKEVFEKARLHKPSILFFDEVDTIGYSRLKASSGNTRGLIDTFLMELDGVNSTTDEVLVMAATNTPWDIDQALKRPGRFDRMIFVAPPDEKARKEIFRLKLWGRYTEEIDVEKLASMTEFFSGADIENVVELATERVLDEIMTTGVERPIKTEDLIEVINSVQPSTLEWLRTAKNYVKYANQSGIYNDIEAYLKKYSKRI